MVHSQAPGMGKGKQTPPVYSTTLCLPVVAKTHLACNCAQILRHSKGGFEGMKFRLMKWYCPRCYRGSRKHRDVRAKGT